METPFDILISGHWQLVLSGYYRKSPPSNFSPLVYNFSIIARVLYLNMADASEKMLLQIDAQNNMSGKVSFTPEEMVGMDDARIRCRLSYVQFIEHINRFGRVLKRKGFTLPLYERVYFFRNKMVEHWDDYIQFLSSSDGFIFSRGKIAIPHTFAGISRPAERPKLQQELTDQFAKCGVTLPSLTDKWYGEYGEIIYTSLGKINSELKGIPEPLVILLFKYCFPTPIYDMEEYCKTLVEWLGTLP